MKKILSLCSALLLLCQVSLFAQNDNDNKNDNKEKKKYEFVKTKSFSKSYNLSSDKVSIQNSFGSVEIKTWSKNEVKVDVAIEVSSNVETLAQKIIDGININSGNSNGVWFKTENKGTNNNNGEKSTMSIDYIVYLPASNPLKVINEFGATIIPDYSGEVDLTSKFGSLKAGTLSNNKSISVEFGKANLEGIANGNVSVKYSKAEIGKLAGNIKMNFEFCSATKMNFDNNVTGLTVKASYSTVSLRPMGEPSVSYSISTSFGSFKNRTSIKFDGGDDDSDHGPKFDFNYNGKSGSGSIPVKITSSFGKIILGEPTAEDIKEKDKNKSKSKTT
jgi:hypothetical protein